MFFCINVSDMRTFTDESPEDFICHLEGCLNRRHVEDNGVVHDCCCFSHAMELQRRKLVISSTFNDYCRYQIKHHN